MDTNKAISILSAILVLFLAAAAFVLSYDALLDLALANGIKPGLAWLWPLTLDAVMIAASLAVLRASLNNEGKLYQWSLVGAFTAASIAFNVVHAPATLLARAIFALPPLVVFLAFELLMKQTGEAVTKRQEVAGLKAELRKEKRQSNAGKPATPGDETRERARAILAERSGISGAALGRELGRSESLGRQLKRELLPVSDNGQGR